MYIYHGVSQVMGAQTSTRLTYDRLHSRYQILTFGSLQELISIQSYISNNGVLCHSPDQPLEESSFLESIGNREPLCNIRALELIHRNPFFQAIPMFGQVQKQVVRQSCCSCPQVRTKRKWDRRRRLSIMHDVHQKDEGLQFVQIILGSIQREDLVLLENLFLTTLVIKTCRENWN